MTVSPHGAAPGSSVYTLGIATLFRDEAPYLREWVEYHRLVGVEHFWLYNDSSRDSWQDALRPHIEAGVVEVINWPIPEIRALIAGQVGAYQDALRRARGRVNWLALIDTDEFLVPHRESTVAACLERHFAHAAAVYVNWRNFGTGGVRLQPAEPLLSRLTACAPPDHPENAVGKTIVRPERALPGDLWSDHHCVLEPGSVYCDGDAEPIPREGIDLEPDPHVHDRYLRLNHYVLRDEVFFRNVKLQRWRARRVDEERIWEHYRTFSQAEDTTVLEFLRDRHSEAYTARWSIWAAP